MLDWAVCEIVSITWNTQVNTPEMGLLHDKTECSTCPSLFRKARAYYSICIKYRLPHLWWWATNEIYQNFNFYLSHIWKQRDRRWIFLSISMALCVSETVEQINQYWHWCSVFSWIAFTKNVFPHFQQYEITPRAESACVTCTGHTHTNIWKPFNKSSFYKIYFIL